MNVAMIFKVFIFFNVLFWLGQTVIASPAFNLYENIIQAPQKAISYLENLPNRNLEQRFQLMVLWHIYAPEKITMESYRQEADKTHALMQEYFNSDAHFFYWRPEEYSETVGADYQACFADLKCLIDAIPYWMAWDAKFDVYLPCDVAQQYHKTAYFDVAGGGSGAHTVSTSTCPGYDKYKFSKELNDYMDFLSHENTMTSEGTIRFVYYASSYYDDLHNQYDPDFEGDFLEDWTEFPYTEWAVQSYYNFKKFNEVIDYGMGAKQAVNALAKHYEQAFGKNAKTARQAALRVLNPPFSQSYQRISKDNLKYMLLSKHPWKAIRATHKNIADYSPLLEFSIHDPQNLANIIQEGKQNANFNIDFPNEFGKTPLMLAAQYGYLDSVKHLFENGADINRQTNEVEAWDFNLPWQMSNSKRSALMYALQEGHEDVAVYLLEHGADIRLKDSQKMTACDYLYGRAPILNPYYHPTIATGIGAYRDEKTPLPFDTERIEKLKQFFCE